MGNKITPGGKKATLDEFDKNFQSILNLHDAPVIIADIKDNRILAFNKAVLSFCGCTAGKLRSKNFGDIFVREDKYAPRTYSYRYKKSSGNRPVINFKKEQLKLEGRTYNVFKAVKESPLPAKDIRLKDQNKKAPTGRGGKINQEMTANWKLMENAGKYSNLFDDSPISMWEEDLSAVKKELVKLKKGGVKDFHKYLKNNPALLKKLVSMVKITNVNKATLVLYKARTKKQMIESLSNVLSEESAEGFKNGILSLFEGKPYFEEESVNYSLDRKPIYISLRSSLVKGYESNWKKVLLSIIDISEKKKSQEALRESEDKFKKMAEKSLIGMYLIQNGIFKYVNPKLAEIFQYEREELIDKKGPVDLTEAGSQNIVERNISKRISGELDSVNYEFDGITKNGDVLNIEVFGSRTTYMGKPAIVGTLLDISGRKKWEEDLRESQRRYKELTDLLPQTIFEIDTEGRVIFVNQSGLKSFNYNADTLNMKPLIYDFLVPKDRGRAAANMLKILKGEKSSETEYTALKKNGITFPMLVFSNRVIRNGKAIGLRGIAVDMSERKLIEEQLRKLSRAVEQSPSSIIITDLFGEIEYVNPRFSKLTGYGLAEVIGKNPRILKSGETPAKVYENLWTTIVSGNTWRGEFHNKKKNGELYWEYASISPIVDQEGKITHFLAIKEDITEKKLIENELLRAKEKAEESDRLKSEFLAQMSHEIRSPLNVILNYNSFLNEELAPQLTEEQKIAISSIDSAGRRLLRTIDLILNMAALQSGYIDLNPVDVDLNKVLTGLAKEFKQSAQKRKIKFTFINKVKKGIIKGDEYIVTEIFVNLIGNAIKYTSEGYVEIALFDNPEKKLSVAVKDTGIGISEEYLPKLFMPFSQEETGYSRRFEGNGLGLALVKKYVEILNAKIKVDSKKGEGTTFTVTFKRNTDSKL